jgi:hypothetical protein
LLQFATRCAAQLRASPSQVVRCDAGHACYGRIPLKQLPDHFLTECGSVNLAAAAYGPEDRTVANFGGTGPRIDRHLNPGGHRHRPNATVFPSEVGDAPPSIPLLNVGGCERSHLRSPQPAAEEYRQDSPVSQTFGRRCVGRVEKLLGLLDGEPVPEPDPIRSDPLYSGDPCSQLRRQQPVVGGLGTYR